MNIYVSDINIDITKPLSEFKIDEFVIGAIILNKETNQTGHITGIILPNNNKILIQIKYPINNNEQYETYINYYQSQLKNIFCNGLLIDIYLD